MKVSTIRREKTGYFSQQQIDMCYNQAAFSDFITQSFSLQSFEEQIQLKKGNFHTENRTALVHSLKNQYKNVNTSEEVLKNIDALNDSNTFTVVTGHQMVLFTGPLYFIYKIGHVIRMCEELKKIHPTYTFVPVYWMASEDHDYEEIKSIHLFNKIFSWETNQSGAVGQYEVKDIDNVIEELKDLFKNHPESEFVHLLDEFKGNNYTEAFRKLVDSLFQKYGVVIVDGDDPDLKRTFLPVMKREIHEQFSEKAIHSTTEQLVLKGGKQQITPREINLFYLSKGVRERLVDNGTSIEISGKGNFSKEEILKMMENEPASFSPNVSLRPLYQEMILPNLCYVGGTGEINYWLQLKGVFDDVKIVFPLLKTRVSMLWIDNNSVEKIAKLNLKSEDFFQELHTLTKQYMEENASEEVDFSSLDEKMNALKKQLIETIAFVDSGLEGFAKSESVKMEKQVAQIKDRLYKITKSKYDKNLKSIQQLKEKLFPNGGLQERYTNFFQLNPDGNYSQTLDEMIEIIQPFDSDFLIVEE